MEDRRVKKIEGGRERRRAHAKAQRAQREERRREGRVGRKISNI
jgi:hypothetical protein